MASQLLRTIENVKKNKILMNLDILVIDFKELYLNIIFKYTYLDKNTKKTYILKGK
tara:strand:+ start:252 stop:419 length:168 start_codon:yes stop_codon:yes gene_type:complete